MRVTIRNGFTPSKSDDFPSAQLVIDVFRAATTTISLLEAQVAELVIANDFEIVKDFHSKNYLIVSEVFDLGIDNSPTLVSKKDLSHQKALLKTSNLTTAISSNFSRSDMFITCFNNLGALTDYFLNYPVDWIEIIPSGHMHRKVETPEDSECALLLKALLENREYEPKWSMINEKVDLRLSQEKTPTYLKSDLEHSLELSTTAIIPRVRKNDDGSFLVTRD